VTVLALRLAAPLQSWGTSSRFVRRNTDRAPSRSGIIGLLAAAQGRRRTDPIEDLLGLRIGIRVDQPGQLERDFQTARTRDGAESMPLSYRFYLADAVFLAAVEGDPALLEALQAAIRRPAYPLALGRRSCPPAGPLEVGLRDGGIDDALHQHPWLAARFHQARFDQDPEITLDTVVDCAPTHERADTVRDDPISFDPRRREYGWRSVLRSSVAIPNPGYRPGPGAVARPDDFSDHDPMSAFGDLP
jgi:CRISPR system Cascade subunit CasD